MNDEKIALSDLASELRLHTKSIHKIIKRLKIVPTKSRRSDSRGQQAHWITNSEAEHVRADARDRKKKDADRRQAQNSTSGRGVYYLFQLEPKFDPTRIKVGWRADLTERERDHKCVAPFIKLIHQWPCSESWERTATAAVTQGCEQIREEVYRAESIKDVVERGDRFFAQFQK